MYGFRISKILGADFGFEFQTDPVAELVEVRKGVDTQVEVRC